MQLLPGGYKERLDKEQETPVGLNLSLHWVPALTGCPLFPADHPMKLAHMSKEERRQPLETLPKELPVGAREALQRMLSHEPEERFGDILLAAGAFAS